jgi:hypothetical protein
MKIVFMIAEGQSHWHDGEARVANDVIEIDDETGQRLIKRGIAAKIEDAEAAPKVTKVIETPVEEPESTSDTGPLESAENESESTAKVDEGVALSEFPKVE